MGDSFVPTRDDRFSFGLWTVGWQGRDPFGDATRAPLDPVSPCTDWPSWEHGGSRSTTTTSYRSALTTLPARRRLSASRRSGRDRHSGGDDDHQPVHPPGLQRGCVHGQRPWGARYAMRKTLRNIDLAAELGAQIFVAWGGREGAEFDAAKDVRAALDRMKEAFDVFCSYVIDRGYSIKFAIEPKPNEPRGDILLPTIGHALAFVNELEHPEMVGLNPEVGHETMAGLNVMHGYAQALGPKALPHRP